MFTLKKLNIVKVTESAKKRDKLIEQGFTLIDVPKTAAKEKKPAEDEKGGKGKDDGKKGS